MYAMVTSGIAREVSTPVAFKRESSGPSTLALVLPNDTGEN